MRPIFQTVSAIPPPSPFQILAFNSHSLPCDSKNFFKSGPTMLDLGMVLSLKLVLALGAGYLIMALL